MTSYVALDLETTGLDPSRDRVTEVAAVRFSPEGRELDRFETLVNPGRPIPYFIQQLTGISDEAVAQAPALPDIAGQLRGFIGEGPVIGHNVSFDLAFLNAAGVSLGVPGVDTAELSRILMPDRQPRGLVELAATLGVEGGGAHHRAGSDASTSAAIFVALLKVAEAIPPALRLQLARLIALHDLALAEVIAGEGWQGAPAGERALPVIRPAQTVPQLTRRDPPLAIPAGQVEAAFAAAPGVVSDFEERQEQLDMADAVATAFSASGHWLMEAGTGVGKSLAYLVPAALYALHNSERVVISTNTIALQEQLLRKDVPALRAMLRDAGVIAAEDDLRVSVLKGRSNYLCMRRWTASFAANAADPDFARLAASVLLWLPETTTGDRSELSLGATEWSTWFRFSAQDADCLARPNAFVKENNCFLQRARKAAEGSHLVIVNHALLLSDIAQGGSALPAFDLLVLDEAHNLE
ncbi:MAG: exonuclease domain-containing protein, partial [Dehalococcoidia bacterium]